MGTFGAIREEVILSRIGTGMICEIWTARLYHSIQYVTTMTGLFVSCGRCNFTRVLKDLMSRFMNHFVSLMWLQMENWPTLPGAERFFVRRIWPSRT
jgi:hypothetical protein